MDALRDALQEIIALSTRTPRRALREGEPTNPTSVSLTKAEQIARAALAAAQAGTLPNPYWERRWRDERMANIAQGFRDGIKAAKYVVAGWGPRIEERPQLIDEIGALRPPAAQAGAQGGDENEQPVIRHSLTIMRLTQACRDAIEAIERGSSTAPVVEALRAAIAPAGAQPSEEAVARALCCPGVDKLEARKDGQTPPMSATFPPAPAEQPCPKCGGSGFSGHGTGYDNVCDECGGQRFAASADNDYASGHPPRGKGAVGTLAVPADLVAGKPCSEAPLTPPPSASAPAESEETMTEPQIVFSDLVKHLRWLSQGGIKNSLLLEGCRLAADEIQRLRKPSASAPAGAPTRADRLNTTVKQIIVALGAAEVLAQTYFLPADATPAMKDGLARRQAQISTARHAANTTLEHDIATLTAPAGAPSEEDVARVIAHESLLQDGGKK